MPTADKSTPEQSDIIRVYEPCRSTDLLKTYKEIADLLDKEVGATMIITHELGDCRNNTINLWQDEPVAYPVGAGLHSVYGCRLLNRLERLMVASECGCVLPHFVGALNRSECNPDRDWIHKLDFSARGNGIAFIGQPPFVCVGNAREGDVIMECIPDFGPTWKIDCFFNIAVGCRVTTDNPLASSRTHSQYEAVAIPREVAFVPKLLGPSLERFGCLYYSIDFMLLKDQFVIIEINTCGVARMEQWVSQRSLYVSRVLEGLRTFLAFAQPTPLRETANRLAVWRRNHACEPSATGREMVEGRNLTKRRSESGRFDFDA